MTITAVDSIISDMVFMAKLNRLLAFEELTGVPGGAIEFHCNPQRRDDNKDRAVDRDFC